jgi:hypothetical protein
LRAALLELGSELQGIVIVKGQGEHDELINTGFYGLAALSRYVTLRNRYGVSAATDAKAKKGTKGQEPFHIVSLD